MAQVVVPVMEPAPSLPEPRKPKPRPVNFKAEQMFAFDTETTRCGKKELRSCQFSFYEGGLLHNIVYSVKGWFDNHDTGRIETLCGEPQETVSETFETVDALRVACQRLYEHLLYGEQTAKRKKVKRCAVAFNANFRLGS